MAQTVPLNWSGRYENSGGPLASGDTHYWRAWGDFGKENRFYLFSVFTDGQVAAEVEVAHVAHYRKPPDGGVGPFVDETHFQIHNNGSDAPVYYYFYIAWSDPINV